MADINNPYADIRNTYQNNLQQQNDWLQQGTQIQNEQIDANTNQTINEIQQNKDLATKDFQKEARGAYTDYQKAINPYGVQAENMFSNGLGNSGYSETSKLNAYNTYQNRYSTARESTDRLYQDFNNQMNQARLEGNKEKAEVALNELNQKMSNLWQQLETELNLANAENSYNQWLTEFEYQKEQDKIANDLAQQQLNASLAKSYYSGGSGSESESEDDFSDEFDEEKAIKDAYNITKEQIEKAISKFNQPSSSNTGNPLLNNRISVVDWANYNALNGNPFNIGNKK